jgi:cyclic pyranopterin phosphate synthase
MTSTDQPKETEAIGFIHMKADTIRMIKENEQGLGEVIALAETAGIHAVHKAHELIPHILQPSDAEITLKTSIYPNGIEAKVRLRAMAPASIESEALLAIATCLVSLFEMCRPVDASMVVSDIRLIRAAH